MMTKTAFIVVPDNTCLQPVFGVPAIRRLVILTKQLGFESTHLVGKVHSLETHLSDLLPRLRFHSAEDVDSLDEAVAGVKVSEGEQVLVMRGGLVIDRRSITHFLDAAAEGCVNVMKPEKNGAFDGMYLLPRENLSAILKTIWSGAENGFPSISEAYHVVPSVTGFPHVLRNREDVKVSESKLAAALAAYTKADDGFMARHFDRHISRYISSKLAHTAILPNHITLLGMSIGLIGALFLSLPGYRPQLLGALLFVLCVIVDGVDGEVARLKLKESAFGHYLDIVTDNIVHAAIFVAIAYGLYHNTGNRVYLWLLWVMLGGFGLCILAVYQCILRRSAEELERSPALIRVMALLSNRDFAYLIALLALFGLLNWFLIGASLGTYLFATALWFISAQEQKEKRAPLAS